MSTLEPADDDYWMQQALLLASEAADHGEVPVGALVVMNNEIIGRGYNRPITNSDPSAHAEIVALRDAAKHIGNYRLAGADLFVTLEPCSMCAGAIAHARIRRLVYAAAEPKSGVVHSQGQFFQQPFINHKPQVLGNVLAEQSAVLLQQFFQRRRAQKKSKP